MIAKIKSLCYFLTGKNLYSLGQYKKALNAFDEAAKLNLTADISRYQKKTLKQIKIAEADLNNNQKSEELANNQLNRQLSKQLEDMESKFQTLQKQMSDLHTNSKLQSAVAAFNESKTENLIQELRQEVKELKSPNYKDEIFFQFTGMQEQVTKLQDRLEEHGEKAEQDRVRLRKNSNQMKGLQTQMYNLESNTSAQVIDLQVQVNENGKRDQEDRDKLNENTQQLKDHNLILQNTNAIDKAKADEYINYLKLEEPLLYIYYKTFYWTIHGFFHAHRILSTDLITYNTDYAETKKDKYLNNTKTTIDKVHIVTKHIPLVSNFTEIANDITHLVHNVVKTKKLKDICG